MFSDPTLIKPVISNRKIGKTPNTWKLTKLLLKHPCFHIAASREIKSDFELNEKASTTCQNVDMKLKQCLEERDTMKYLYQKRKKVSN